MNNLPIANILLQSSATASELPPKLGVVVGVLLIIFSCIVLYLIRIDRKISKLEKDNE